MQPPFLGLRAGRVLRARPPARITLSGPAVQAGVPGHGAWGELVVSAAHDWRGRPCPTASRRPVAQPSTGVEVKRGGRRRRRLQLRLRAPVPVPRVRVGSRVVAFRFARLAWKDGLKERGWFWEWMPFCCGVHLQTFEARSMKHGGVLARFALREDNHGFRAVRQDLLFEGSASLMTVYRIPDGAVVAEFQERFGRGVVVSPSGHQVVYRREADRQWYIRERRDGFTVERLFGAPWDFQGRVLSAAGEFVALGPTPTAVQVWTKDSGLATHDCLGVPNLGTWGRAGRFAFLVLRGGSMYGMA